MFAAVISVLMDFNGNPEFPVEEQANKTHFKRSKERSHFASLKKTINKNSSQRRMLLFHIFITVNSTNVPGKNQNHNVLVPLSALKLPLTVALSHKSN